MPGGLEKVSHTSEAIRDLELHTTMMKLKVPQEKCISTPVLAFSPHTYKYTLDTNACNLQVVDVPL